MEPSTLTLLFAIAGIALVDSINPSALLVTGYILLNAPTHRKMRAVLAYVAGIFCLYSTVGALLTLGFTALLNVAGNSMENELVYIAQAVIGAGMLIWSFLPSKSAATSGPLKPTRFSTKSLFMLGIIVTGVEFVTALPYLAAIGLLQQAEIDTITKLGILFGYNLIFIMPPLALAAVYKLKRERFEKWQSKRRSRQGSKPSDTLQWIVGVIGILLLLHAVSSLL